MPKPGRRPQLPFASLRSALIELPPTGEVGFEGLVAADCAQVAGTPSRLVGSGRQFGRDVEAVVDGTGILFEAERYDSPLSYAALSGKLQEALARSGRRVEVWGAAATIPLDVQDVEDLRAYGEGLALVTADGQLVEVVPMPVLADGPKGRPTVNGPLLAAIVRRWALASASAELVGPRPGEAAGGAFSFGRARSLVEGVPAAQGVPARMVTAPVWKRHCGIPAGREGVKDMARAEACRRWPGMAERFSARGSDGLAEAGLIAVAGMAREALGR